LQVTIEPGLLEVKKMIFKYRVGSMESMPVNTMVRLQSSVVSGNQWLKNDIPVAGAIGQEYLVKEAKVAVKISFNIIDTLINPEEIFFDRFFFCHYTIFLK
jgi:hypothetical protein